MKPKQRRRPPVPPGPGAIVIATELPPGYVPPSASVDPEASTSEEGGE
ncbi:hypothetical protein GCM10023196_035860 [Actinoallomurus vinaceus]|uniref:Uncharacterized protein n=1 Tax=Actinoallomurus vinaceus TaxID=1080074 RepID=A0ABP8U956_9ACTN